MPFVKILYSHYYIISFVDDYKLQSCNRNVTCYTPVVVLHSRYCHSIISMVKTKL